MRRRGFTFAELAVTLALLGFVVALVLGTFRSQHASFEAMELARTAQASVRDATLELERTLRVAGFGLDPRFAFDFRHYRCATPPCRDRVDGPDELVFHARTAAYRYFAPGTGPGPCNRPEGCVEGLAWHVAAADASTLTVKARTGDAFRKGGLLLVACPGAAATAIVTLDRTVPPVAADEDVPLALAPSVAGDPYRDAAQLASACFGGGGALAFQIDRYRYFVEPAAYGVPYLMLDPGADTDLDGKTPAEGDRDDLVPVARGIEELQVAYVLARSAALAAPDSDRDWSVADVPGLVEEPNPLLPAPVRNATSTDPLRATLHPANIRAVRVSLGVRTFRSDPAAAPNWPGDPLVSRENRSVVAADVLRLRRFTTTTTVTVRNLASRADFLF